MPEMSANVNQKFVGKMVFICSVNQEGFIGKDGNDVWINSHDRRRFRRLTSGHTIAYGRGTWEALGCKPLPDRVNIVVSKTLPLDTPGVHVVRSPGMIKHAYEAHGRNLLYIIGGAQIFGELIDQADYILLTQAQDKTIGDTPLGFQINGEQWKITMSMPMSKIEGQAEGEIDIMEKLFATLPDHTMTDKPDTAIQMMGTYKNWFVQRFIPICTTWHTGEKGLRERILATEKVWQASRQFAAPAFAPKTLNSGGLDYLIQIALAGLPVSNAIRFWFYGLQDVPAVVVKAIEEAEIALVKLLNEPGERVLSHTYLTLERVGGKGQA